MIHSISLFAPVQEIEIARFDDLEDKDNRDSLKDFVRTLYMYCDPEWSSQLGVQIHFHDRISLMSFLEFIHIISL